MIIKELLKGNRVNVPWKSYVTELGLLVAIALDSAFLLLLLMTSSVLIKVIAILLVCILTVIVLGISQLAFLVRHTDSLSAEEITRRHGGPVVNLPYPFTYTELGFKHPKLGEVPWTAVQLVLVGAGGGYVTDSMNFLVRVDGMKDIHWNEDEMGVRRWMEILEHSCPGVLTGWHLAALIHDYSKGAMVIYERGISHSKDFTDTRNSSTQNPTDRNSAEHDF